MGWSKACKSSPKTIVILQWGHSSQPTSPTFQFWTLDCPEDGQNHGLPTPAVVPGRMDEPYSMESGLNTSTSPVHLPPLLTYDAASHSILTHHLMVNDNINAECIRWGPGIHLTQIQTKERLFSGCPSSLNGAKYLSPPASILSPSGLLTAVAMDNADGTMAIKYRMKNLGRDAIACCDVVEAYKSQEQTLRAVVNPAAPHATKAPPKSNIPVHMCSIGPWMQYLLLISLGRVKDQSKNLLSVYKIPESMAISDASTMAEPNRDTGIRWQLQTFELPVEVEHVAPVALRNGIKPYLAIFYFYKGALHYARAEYAGSGSFVDFVDKTLCVPHVTEASAPTQIMGKPTRSAFSLSSRLSVFSQGSRTDANVEDVGKDPQQSSLPLAAEGCQPYVIVANGFVWVFYEGADMKGTYARRKVPIEDERLDMGWESASWVAQISRMDSISHEVDGFPAHFIPVAVPGDFMAMY